MALHGILTICLASWQHILNRAAEKGGENGSQQERGGADSCTRQKGIVCWLFSCSFRYLHLMSMFAILEFRQDLKGKSVSLMDKLT